MAWNYARYVGRVAEAGKAEYPLPMYVNTWLYSFGKPNQPGANTAAAALCPICMDVWRAGAPRIDILAPDLYNDFAQFSALYTRSGNPLFIAEARGGPVGAARALYALGRHDAIGFSVFAIEYNLKQDPANELGRVYKAISQLMPLIADHQGKGAMTGVLLEENGQVEKARLGDYTMTVAFGRDRWDHGFPVPARRAARRSALRLDRARRVLCHRQQETG